MSGYQTLPGSDQGGDRQLAPSRSRSATQEHRHLDTDAGEEAAGWVAEPAGGGAPEAVVEEGFANSGVGERLLHLGAGRSEGTEREEGEAEERTPLLGSSSRGGSASRRRDEEERQRRPWYRRPSPGWLLPSAFLMAFAYAMTVAPKLEVYNQLVCRALVDAGAAPSCHHPSGNGTDPVIPPSTPSDGINPTFVLAESGFEVGIGGLPLGPPPPFSWEIAFPSHNSTLPHQPINASDPDEIRTSQSEWSNACRRSPLVSSAVARLNTALLLTSGVLGSLTAGFWGGLSDRYGRKVILVISMLGFLVNDGVFLATVTWHRFIPYQALVVGPLVEGCLGGMAVAQAAVTAYTSDCTPSGSRARVFSTFFGVLMAGMAFGPTIGGLVVRWTGTVLAPFYVSALGHAVFALFSGVVVPESLSKRQAVEAQRKEEERRLKREELEKKEDLRAREEGWSWVRRWVMVGGKRFLVRAFGFLRPVGLLLPKKGGLEGVEISGAAKAGGKRDWNLTILALAYALYALMFGAYGVKMQYAIFKFDWGPVENGYYLTLLGASRVVALLVILPVFLRFVKPNSPAPSAALRRREVVDDRVGGPEGARAKTSALVSEEMAREEEEERRVRHVRLLHDSHFDLRLARYSMLIDMLTYLFLIFTTTPIPFLIAGSLQALGGGVSPAMQSLALSLVPPHHSGKVLASLSVIQSAMSSVLGPLVFGLLYANTVGRFAETIFVLGAAVYGTSFACLLLVRLKNQQRLSSPEEEPEEGTRSGEEVRGRSQSPKHLRDASSGSDPLKNASQSAFVLHGGIRRSEEQLQPQQSSSQ